MKNYILIFIVLFCTTVLPNIYAQLIPHFYLNTYEYIIEDGKRTPNRELVKQETFDTNYILKRELNYTTSENKVFINAYAYNFNDSTGLVISRESYAGNDELIFLCHYTYNNRLKIKESYYQLLNNSLKLDSVTLFEYANGKISVETHLNEAGKEKYTINHYYNDSLLIKSLTDFNSKYKKSPKTIDELFTYEKGMLVFNAKVANYKKNITDTLFKKTYTYNDNGEKKQMKHYKNGVLYETTAFSKNLKFDVIKNESITDAEGNLKTYRIVKMHRKKIFFGDKESVWFKFNP